MAVRDIAYAELYARDESAAVDYFASFLGFVPVADRTARDSTSVLLTQGDVRLIVTSGPACEEFLDGHGEGIADIALTCDDATDTWTRAVAAGATPVGPVYGNPAVRAFGGVRHVLLPGMAELPPCGEWTARPRETTTRSRITLLDHVAVCVEGELLQEYASFYEDAFGFYRYSAEYVEFGDQAMDSVVVRNPAGRVIFTLVAPDPAKSAGQLNAFLDRNGGPGVQHLAFLVEDIVASVHDFRARGVDFLSAPANYYEMVGHRFADLEQEVSSLRATDVLVDRDEWGYLLQLFSRSPYERNTLFYELIERRGARGFGGRNIRALYEAVERDRLAAE
jgi:4-hydroxymandelate synthase